MQKHKQRNSNWIGYAWLVSFMLFITFIAISVIGNIIKKPIISKKGYTGCYVCEDNTYIKFKGKDSLKLRKKVEDQFGCKPIKTIKKCTTDKVLE